LMTGVNAVVDWSVAFTAAFLQILCEQCQERPILLGAIFFTHLYLVEADY